MNDTQMPSVVQFGTVEQHLIFAAVGNATQFVDGGELKRRQYIHRVRIAGLETGQKYCKN